LEADIAGSRSNLPARIGGLQTRAGRDWVRATQSVRLNDPDGWMGSNGPVWWVGNDSLQGNIGDFTPYGYRPGGTHYGGNGYTNPIAGHVGTNGILPAITRATSIVTGPVARTTWRYLEGTATDVADVNSGTEPLPRPLWVADPQLLGRIPGGQDDRPTLTYARRLGAHDFWRTFLAHALWFGTGLMMYVEDSAGQPKAGTLRIVNPDRWGYTADGRYVLDPAGDDPAEADGDGYIAFDTKLGRVYYRLVALRGFAPNDGNVAEGALTRSGLLLATGTAMGSYLSGIMSSGVPSGVLKVGVPNFGPDDADNLKQRWMDAHGGVKKSVAVLNAGVDFTPLQLSVVDSDVVNAKGSWLVDLAHAFNLSAAYLDASTGSGSNLTYANLSDRRKDLLDLTLAEWGRSMEDLVTAILPYGQKMRVDWTGFINTDPREDLDFVKAGLEQGWLSKAEARDRMGLVPDPELTDPPANTEGTTDGDT
jgi:HK97 family phage portal protein